MSLNLIIKKVKVEKILFNKNKYSFVVNFLENYYSTTIDTQADIPIEHTGIEELKLTCGKVIDNPKLCEKLLPAYIYDETYFSNVKEMYKICDSLLEEFDKLKDEEFIVLNIAY